MLPAVLTENSKKILDTRYIDPVHDKTVDGLWDRVSMGNPEYRRLLSQLLFLPNSPTLFNLGLPTGGTLSACFVFDVEDCLLGDWPLGGLDEPMVRSILGTNFKAACVAKAGGGVGYYLGKLRPRGAEVKSTHKKACGPVTVLKYYNFLRSLITQGGKRDLAQMGVLDAHHPDIREFIHVKDDDPQALGSFNISVSWRDKYLQGIDWDRFKLIEPGVMVGMSEWAALWWEQCQSAWKSGDPGVLFWDTINRANATPHLGDINATNPCGETPNLNDEPCNLGSIAYCRYLTDHGPRRTSPKRFTIDWDMLKEDIRTAIRFMDDILDANNFPHPDITRMAQATRKLGLGAMGVADLLAILGIPYDSNEAVDLVGELARHQKEISLQESAALADRKGPYPAWETAPPEVKAKFPRVRNSTRGSIAPTGTIALIAGVWGSIEPFFAFDAERTTYEGIKMKDGISEQTRKILHETGHVPKVASDIHWKWHVDHQAAWQRHMELGVSKTINMPNTATVQEISDAYRYMWETGCKGGTIFRDGCRSEQVLVKRETKSVYETKPAAPPPVTAKEPIEVGDQVSTGGSVTHSWIKEAEQAVNRLLKKGAGTIAQEGLALLPPLVENGRRKLPDTRRSVTHKFRVGGVKGYVTVGLFPDGTPGEIFLKVGKQGSTVDGMMDSWAIAVSTQLQHGVTVAELVKRHGGSSFPPAGFTDNPVIRSATSVPDYVVRWLAAEFAVPGAGPLIAVSAPPMAGKSSLDPKVEQAFSMSTGEYCPDCSGELVKEGNCKKCLAPGCGFSKC